MNTFEGLTAQHPEQFARIAVSNEVEELAGMEFVSFSAPRDLVVSRWWPGNRVTEIMGVNTDEAIALLLGDTLNTFEDLNRFRKVLATPAVAASIITGAGGLFPRENVPIKGRAYQVTEEKIAEVTKARLDAYDLGSEPAVVMGYTHAISRVLSARGWVAPSKEARIVKTASSYVMTDEDVKRLIMVDSMRSVFSDSRIKAAMATLDQDATPAVVGELIGNMFRYFSKSIPEVSLKLEQYQIALSAIRMFNLDPQALPKALQAHASLQELAGFANFLVFSTLDPNEITPLGVSVTEVREACDAMLQVVRSAPNIEVITLSQFAEHFGEAPAASPDGIRRGVVLYKTGGQTSRMEVADVYPTPVGADVAQVEPTYVKAASIAQPLTSSLLVPEALHGLANIVADELALEDQQSDDNCVLQPILLTINVSKQDLIFLAMSKARSVSLIRIPGGLAPSAQLAMLYEVPVAEQWRMHVMAATPSLTFMRDPAQVVLYTSEMVNRVGRALPSRPQGLNLEIMRDITYIGPIDEHLFGGINEPFNLILPIDQGGEKLKTLTMKIHVLGSLVGYDGEAYDRGTAYYAAVKEPGVDRDLQTMLWLALAYAAHSSNDVQADKARSWLIVRFAPLMMNASVRVMAEKAVSTAIIEAKVDGRRLTPQLREVYTRAAFGTVLAILSKFGKIDGATAAGITRAVPTSTLSVQAGLTLAQLPAWIQRPGSSLNQP